VGTICRAPNPQITGPGRTPGASLYMQCCVSLISSHSCGVGSFIRANLTSSNFKGNPSLDKQVRRGINSCVSFTRSHPTSRCWVLFTVTRDLGRTMRRPRSPWPRGFAPFGRVIEVGRRKLNPELKTHAFISLN
jgi:hypothetical protein